MELKIAKITNKCTERREWILYQNILMGWYFVVIFANGSGFCRCFLQLCQFLYVWDGILLRNFCMDVKIVHFTIKCIGKISGNLQGIFLMDMETGLSFGQME